MTEIGDYGRVICDTPAYPQLLLLLLLLKEVGSARPGDSYLYPVSQKTPCPTIPTYRPNKGKRKNSRSQEGIEYLRPIKKDWPCS